MTKLSVVILNWNGRDLLAECLGAIERQTMGKLDLWVVDNGSKDDSVSWVRRNYPHVHLLALDHNAGFSIANNRVLRQIRTPYVALLNNDTVASPDWAETICSALDAEPRAGFAASKLLFYHQPDLIDRIGDGYTRAGAGKLRARGEPADRCNLREWVFGACAGAALYRTKMLQDVGLFDEDFFLLYEDLDLSFRAQLKGYQCIYVPEAIVYHQASRSIGYDSAKSVYYGHRNLEWVYVQNMPSGLILKSLLGHLMYDMTALVFFCVKGHGAAFLRAKLDAFRGLKRALAKRRRVQRSRRVDTNYLWRLMEPEDLWNRFYHRRRLQNESRSRNQQ